MQSNNKLLLNVLFVSFGILRCKNGRRSVEVKVVVVFCGRRLVQQSRHLEFQKQHHTIELLTKRSQSWHPWNTSKVLEQSEGNDAIMKERSMLIALIQTTCSVILSPDGFGYDNVQEAKNYLGLDRNRNFWHDGWTVLSLVKARKYLWPSDTNYGEIKLDSIWQALIDMYGTGSDGTVWHWPKEQKNDSSNVRYCGDNSLAHAIKRTITLRMNAVVTASTSTSKFKSLSVLTPMGGKAILCTLPFYVLCTLDEALNIRYIMICHLLLFSHLSFSLSLSLSQGHTDPRNRPPTTSKTNNK